MVVPEDTQSLIHATALCQMLVQTLEKMNHESLVTDEFIVELHEFCERSQARLASLRQTH